MRLLYSNKNDLTAIAQCHIQCFKNSLSPKLGLAYVKKTFEWFLVSSNRFLFHIEQNGQVIAYCGGFVPQYIGDGSTSGMMQYSMRQAVTGAILRPWLLLHHEVRGMYPLILKNISRKISNKKIKKTADPVAPFNKRVGLVVIGVHPEFRGSGAFQMLMAEFEAKAKTYHLTKLVLSVKKDNIRAIKAYTKQGWFIVNEHAPTFEMCKYL